MNAHIPPVAKARAFASLLLICTPAASIAAALTNKTLEAWEAYIQTVNSRTEERLHGGLPFLWVDESNDRGRRVRAGEVLVAPVGDHSPIKVPKGLVHDWIGAMLVPNATLEDIFAVVRDYGRKEFFKPLVIDSKSLGGDGTDYGFTLLMLNKSIFAKAALLSEWDDRYIRVD
jgi:hypothetical protein